MIETIRLSHGLRVAPDTAIDPTGRVAALLALCPEGTAVAGRAAAWLHGMWLPDAEPPERVDVIVHPEIPAPRDRCASRRTQLRARRRALLADEITVVAGIPMTTPARTWLDLAESLSMADLVALGDSALRTGTSADQLHQVVARARRRRGVVAARAALPWLDARAESRPESHLRYTLVANGLPAPRVNEPIFDQHGQWLAVPDLSYDDARLALEYNGVDHFTTERGRRDITRAFDLEDRGGWHTLTVGPAEVFGRPHQIATLVRHLRRVRLGREPG